MRYTHRHILYCKLSRLINIVTILGASYILSLTSSFLLAMHVIRIRPIASYPVGLRNTVISVFLCLFVHLSDCPLAYLTNHKSQFSMHVRPTCGRGSVLRWRHVFPVLWMTSCFHIMQRIGQNQSQRVCFVQFARWRHGGNGSEVCRLSKQERH